MATQTIAPTLQNIKKNSLGTASFDLQIKGMRQPQRFSTYPMSKGGSTEQITIQSDKRIGTICLTTGKGSLSASHANGAYFHDLSLDKLANKMTDFQLSPEQLTALTNQIKGTASPKAGTNGVVTVDNSMAAFV